MSMAQSPSSCLGNPGVDGTRKQRERGARTVDGVSTPASPGNPLREYKYSHMGRVGALWGQICRRIVFFPATTNSHVTTGSGYCDASATAICLSSFPGTHWSSS